MRQRLASEEGAVTGMVAVLALALLACAGLAYDGGALIEASAAARGTATAAARAGAQELSVEALHGGTTGLAPDRATAAAQALLDAAGATGTVVVDIDSVNVTVHTTYRMRLLPIPDRAIDAAATATAVSDVLGGRP